MSVKNAKKPPAKMPAAIARNSASAFNRHQNHRNIVGIPKAAPIVAMAQSPTTMMALGHVVLLGILRSLKI